MDRTVPRTGSEEIELYLRTFYSLLRSTAEVKIQTLEEVHANINSSLHPQARPWRRCTPTSTPPCIRRHARSWSTPPP